MEEVFAIEELGDSPVPVLVVRGEIDVSTAPELRDRLLRTAHDGHSTVVVDLSEVTFLDSTALGVLVSGLKRFRAAGGDLRLVVTGRSVSKVLEITGLVEVFPIFETVPAALSAGAA
ncbi:MAG: STAS domain-containing protein [Acidimicrobiales bacterium]